MPTFAEVRQKYPQYDDLSDEALAQALHRKFYADMPEEQFRAKVGLGPAESQQSQDLRGELSAMTQDPSGSLRAQQEQYRKEQFDALPAWKKAAVAAGDVANIAGDAATFGMGDRFSAALRAPFTDKSYTEELAAMRDNTMASRDRAGSAGVAADLLGMAGTAGALAKSGVRLGGRFGTVAMKGPAGLAARTGLMGVEGAAFGAADAAGHGRDVKEGAIVGLLAGGAGNVAAEGASKLIGKAAGMFNRKPSVPSLEDIASTKSAAYKRADEAGIIFSPQAANRLTSKITDDLAEFGYDPALQPGAAAVINRIAKLDGKNFTLKGLDTIRKVAGNGYIPGNKANNEALRIIVSHIDDLTTNPVAGDILGGNSKAGSSALKEARDFASRQFKLEKVQKAVQQAELDAAASGSGGNVDNRTRQLIKALLKRERGFTADERALLERIVKGTGTQNALRLAGKLSPSGNGLMAALGVGGAMVNPAIGAVSLGGIGAKALADRATSSNVRALEQLIRAGGKASALQAAPNAVQLLAQSKRDALARALMLGALSANRQQQPRK